MQFELEQILGELGRKSVVIFVGKDLKVTGRQNDFRKIIELLLKNGYRNVKKADLSVGTKFLLIRLSLDRVKRSPKQHSLGLHFIEITDFTPAAIVAQKRKLAEKRLGFVFERGTAENMYGFKSLAAIGQRGCQVSDYFISGSSVMGLPFPPFNSPDETEVCLIKI